MEYFSLFLWEVIEVQTSICEGHFTKQDFSLQFSVPVQLLLCIESIYHEEEVTKIYREGNAGRSFFSIGMKSILKCILFFGPMFYRQQ